ncbi:MAG: NUDIX hydrolase [Desulfomicrobium sp.]|nr:NUDIX hydrolase [Pseudomonadota bacterium]MBV1711730.1 NUDIX hydrolase [Desulfomicrobium sp.]MBU4572682.1 NUDIX hydrolase [Pseudomonadota bacterium]MBU4593537.1 NUDIX hydrolase [Pseudomonadota bacterium]MBV1720459.1 NUDIX hydrolase [Desulfomicrobium sp.]
MTTTAGPIRHDRYRFCPACGASLELQRLRPDEPERLICSKCSGVVYLDPKVVTCVILEIGGKILLMRRKREGDSDKWLLPGGYVDEGEPVEQAAIREIREEVSLDITLDGLVGVFSYAGWPPVIIVYSAHLDSAEPKAGEETEDLDLFTRDEIPWNNLAFPSTRDALLAYVQGRTCQPLPLSVSTLTHNP